MGRWGDGEMGRWEHPNESKIFFFLSTIRLVPFVFPVFKSPFSKLFVQRKECTWGRVIFILGFVDLNPSHSSDRQ